MKEPFLFILILMIIQTANAQFVLETKNGEALFSPFIALDGNDLRSTGLLKFNTGDQSIGFDFFKAPKKIEPKYSFWTLGLKAKPSEGFASVIKSGQFSPSVVVGGAVCQMKIFDRELTKPENRFIDWGALFFNITTSRLPLYKSDTSFKNQIYNKNFSGFSFGVNYNALISSKYLLSFKIGSTRKNNYDDLSSLEISDIKTSFDSTSNTTRNVIRTKVAKQGILKEFDAYPISIAFSKFPKQDSLGLSIGYSIYLSTLASNIESPKTDIGCILYLSTNKQGVGTPNLGVNFQFNDFFDVTGLNNGLLKRVSIGLISNFSIR